jgi:hypothetical protein
MVKLAVAEQDKSTEKLRKNFDAESKAFHRQLAQVNTN